MLVVGAEEEAIVSFDDTSSLSREHFLTSLYSDPGPGAVSSGDPTDDEHALEECATLQFTSGGSSQVLSCYGNDWPCAGSPSCGSIYQYGPGLLGVWAEYILVGMGAHTSNHSTRLGGDYTDGAYFIR